MVELLESPHRDGHTRFCQEFVCAKALVLLGKCGRRVERRILVDQAHIGRSAVGVRESGRTRFGTGHRPVVERLAGQVVGHAQSHAARVEVGEDRFEQPAPPIKRGLEELAPPHPVPSGARHKALQEFENQRRHRRLQFRRPDAGTTVGLLVDGYSDSSHSQSRAFSDQQDILRSTISTTPGPWQGYASIGQITTWPSLGARRSLKRSCQRILRQNLPARQRIPNPGTISGCNSSACQCRRVVLEMPACGQRSCGAGISPAGAVQGSRSLRPAVRATCEPGLRQ